MVLDEFSTIIQNELAEVEKEFQTMLHAEIDLIGNIINHISKYKGKRLRPILLLLCSGLSGGISKSSIKAATIIELLHTATLIHDDVVDESELRRGGPSVNSIWSSKISILIGDYLFSAVLQNLSNLDNLEMIKIVSNVSKRMSQGELMQMQFGHNYDIDEKAYFQLIGDKTASLLAATCELGALTSINNTKNNRQVFYNLGEYIGLAFQIKDDLLDFIGTEEALGKPTSKDLIENNITLPLLYGLNNSNNHHQTEILEIIQNGAQKENIKVLKKFAEESGGIEYSIKKADELVQKAMRLIEKYDDNEYRRSLKKLIEFTTQREF